MNDSAKLTINGGSFSPNWNDGSSVFVNNSGYEAEISVYGGTFETKIGANVPAELNGDKIMGGTFGAPVAEAMCGQGYIPADNGDGTWTVVKAVAYVNNQHWASGWYTRETGYATLEEAIAACEGEKTMTIGKKEYISEMETVTLLCDIDLNGPIVIG